jgi:hypothetical protein
VPRLPSFRPSLLGILIPVSALLAFEGRLRDVGDVTGHPRFRTVDEDTGATIFVGVRVTATSPAVLLTIVDTLADWVKTAKGDAAKARVDAEWDVVHDIELTVGNDAMYMTAAEFAQYVHDLRYREHGISTRSITGP